MRVKVLGSAAGGGFPQWNCACSNCSRLRTGALKGRPRTQAQIAFSPDPDSQIWFLVSASPDLRAQILSAPELRPRDTAPTHSPIAGDRKSTRLNSSHQIISYAVFCLKKKNTHPHPPPLHPHSPPPTSAPAPR